MTALLFFTLVFVESLEVLAGVSPFQKVAPLFCSFVFILTWLDGEINGGLAQKEQNQKQQDLPVHLNPRKFHFNFKISSALLNEEQKRSGALGQTRNGRRLWVLRGPQHQVHVDFGPNGAVSHSFKEKLRTSTCTVTRFGDQELQTSQKGD